MPDRPDHTVTDRGRELWTSTDGAGFVREAIAGGGWDAPHAAVLGYRVTVVEPGRVELAWEVPPALLNPAGIAHGGFLVALLDDAAGLSIATTYPRFVPQLTVQLHTDFLRPVLPDRTHRIVGEVVRRGRSTSLADASVLDPDGVLLARCSGVFQPNRTVVPEPFRAEAGL